MKFRKKPVVIEAHRWTGKEIDLAAFAAWAAHSDLAGRKARGETLSPNQSLETPFDVISEGGGKLRLEIKTLEGTMTADPGEWIICGVRGGFYPCKNDVFEATYEPA